ncbi:4380_t:CDS:2, partial [Dentiscutata heterogama]
FCDWSYPSILNGKEHFNQHLYRDHKEIFADLLKKHFLFDYNQIYSNWISEEYDYGMATFYFLKYRHLFIQYNILFFDLDHIDSSCSFQRFIIAMQSLLRVKIVPPISRGKDQDVNTFIYVITSTYQFLMDRDLIYDYFEHKEAFEELSLKYFLRDYTYLQYNWITRKCDYIDSSWSIQCLVIAAHLLHVKLYLPPLML